MKKPKTFHKYSFFFAPEGRLICDIWGEDLKQAKAHFYRYRPEYKKAKGEIYWKVDND